VKPDKTDRASRPEKPDKLIDRTEQPTRALVVVPSLAGPAARAWRPGEIGRDDQERLAEAVGLAQAVSGLEVVDSGVVRLSQPRPATLLGSGKVDELTGQILAQEIDIVIVDYPLSPVQQRNLERAWKAKVLDRTGLILEIFGERARTKEGRLQVELAHLNYQKGRLVRSWTHLERQRGGVGFMGGPGETQIEADRRQIQERIGRLEKDLAQVRRTRQLHRKARKKAPHPVIALVGYTNAGKSTLFNRLSGAEVLAKDQLFATLDPTLRKVDLPHGMTVLFSDTVGFISDLPTDLIAAFRATLEEVEEAEVILHVRDISAPETAQQAEDVESTLRLLDIDPTGRDRIVEVWNKIDLIDEARLRNLSARAANDTENSEPVLVSAWTGEGIDALLQRIETLLASRNPVFRLDLPLSEGEELAWVYRNCEVLERTDGEEGIYLTVRAAPRAAAHIRDRLSGRLDDAG